MLTHNLKGRILRNRSERKTSAIQQSMSTPFHRLTQVVQHQPRETNKVADPNLAHLSRH